MQKQFVKWLFTLVAFFLTALIPTNFIGGSTFDCAIAAVKIDPASLRVVEIKDSLRNSPPSGDLQIAYNIC